MPKNQLDAILDQAKALITKGKGTRKELGDYLDSPKQRIYDWVFSPNRRHPKALIALKIEAWVKSKKPI